MSEGMTDGDRKAALQFIRDTLAAQPDVPALRSLRLLLAELERVERERDAAIACNQQLGEGNTAAAKKRDAARDQVSFLRAALERIESAANDGDDVECKAIAIAALADTAPEVNR